MHESMKNLALRRAEDAASRFYFIVPFPRDPDFVCRPAISAWISRPIRVFQLVAGPCGMGGFGKSQLAIQFTHEVHARSSETNVSLVYGRDKATFEESYRVLANTLLIPCRQDPEGDVLVLVRG